MKTSITLLLVFSFFNCIGQRNSISNNDLKKVDTTKIIEPTLSNEFSEINPYIDKVLIKLKEESFPDLMHYPDRADLEKKKDEWARTNPTYYQLYLWAKSCVNGKIRIKLNDYSKLSPYLKSEVDDNPNIFIVE